MDSMVRSSVWRGTNRTNSPENIHEVHSRVGTGSEGRWAWFCGLTLTLVEQIGKSDQVDDRPMVVHKSHLRYTFFSLRVYWGLRGWIIWHSLTFYYYYCGGGGDGGCDCYCSDDNIRWFEIPSTSVYPYPLALLYTLTHLFISLGVWTSHFLWTLSCFSLFLLTKTTTFNDFWRISVHWI